VLIQPIISPPSYGDNRPPFPWCPILVPGPRPLTTGYWLLATGYWLLATGYWLLATGYWLLATGYWPPPLPQHGPRQ
jgi:hypothetical protein